MVAHYLLVKSIFARHIGLIWIITVDTISPGLSIWHVLFNQILLIDWLYLLLIFGSQWNSKLAFLQLLHFQVGHTAFHMLHIAENENMEKIRTDALKMTNAVSFLYHRYYKPSINCVANELLNQFHIDLDVNTTWSLFYHCLICFETTHLLCSHEVLILHLYPSPFSARWNHIYRIHSICFTCYVFTCTCLFCIKSHYIEIYSVLMKFCKIFVQ